MLKLATALISLIICAGCVTPPADPNKHPVIRIVDPVTEDTPIVIVPTNEVNHVR